MKRTLSASLLACLIIASAASAAPTRDDRDPRDDRDQTVIERIVKALKHRFLKIIIADEPSIPKP